MMLLTIISLILSFLLQGIMSNYLTVSKDTISWALTIYPLITILVLTPYFENKKKNIILVFLIGLLIDITYTNTFILNASIFIAIYFISKSFHFFFPYNLLTINISNILSIISYHIINFLFLSLIRYDSYGIKFFLKMITHSLLMTIIYGSIFYLIIEHITKRLELKEIK